MTAKPEPVEQGVSQVKTVRDSSKAFEDSLSQAELAKRFGINESSVSRNKEKENFPEWSQKRDPESVPWKYCGKSKRFIKCELL